MGKLRRMEEARLPKLVLDCTLSTIPEKKVSAAYTLQQLSGIRENRSKLALHPGFLPAICGLMEPSNSAVDGKLQECAASVLVNLLLEDPAIDGAIIGTPGMLEGVSH